MRVPNKTLRNDPDRRMDNTVAGTRVDSFPTSDLARLDRDRLPYWIAALWEGEQSVRRLRQQLEALLEGKARACLECGGPVFGRADRATCSAKCRKAMHRRRARASRQEP